ncbi:MAG: hypothetical protein A2784_03920 [Candidatus Chisholmbacteria bacterium RIFCSPHIGHO2_01_FULL_48_12]|uniref:Uncharacterized protein n=1 Tax=Candidatus Chisholmbacteria bacterium RIFCSPHIGHO2_01_FULL_48_12 TaxID=1797589 RepID=A0A1G1VLA3_9BACT|nr:MAG: hypothetical protein A2784_03920 [Candidatus Chisholmbacteria bacterium RIFCSPHIGHO2_01_FULL_48_12]
MTKRRKFVLVSGLLTGTLAVTQAVGVEYRYQLVAGLGIVSLGLSAVALKEDLRGVEWVMALILPTMYPVSVGLFYFLLPRQWWSWLFGSGLFWIGMYALLLTTNIFTVAAVRTIQLLRAAQAVGFLLTLVTAFFLFDTVLSFRLPGMVNAVLVGVATGPLLAAGLWSMKLESTIERQVWLYSGVMTAVAAGMAWGISFWPVGVTVGSLFLVAMMYVGLGLTQQYLSGRLFRNTAREYLIVGLVVVVTMVMLTRWAG